MTTLQPPELSVILATDSLATVEKILACLRAQSRADRVELLFVAPANAGLEDDDARVPGFASVRVVEVEDVAALALARSRGVRAASAPLVLFAETHAYPAPGYLEALIDAHARPWAAVGPSVRNANPGSTISWACLLLDYGRWVELAKSGPIPDVPGYSSAYKRALLLDMGDELEQLMNSDAVMHAELRARGHELYLESSARVDHLNVSRIRWAAVEHFESGRAFAATRALGWSRPRRLVYAAASPLIPAVRLRRILAQMNRCGGAPSLARLLPALVLLLIASAIGEFAGYLFGVGSTDHLSQMELHKVRYVGRRERELDEDRSRWPR